MRRSIFRRALSRVLHPLARSLPGARSLRPMLHRMRGVSVGRNVFIGDDVYLESEYPEAVEIHAGVQIAVRAIILAHTRGPGKIVIEEDVYIGPGTLIVCSGGRTLTIGAGAVIGAGSVVTNDVAPQTLVMANSTKAVAKALVPLTRAEKPEQFLRGLVPLAHKNSESAKNG